MNKALHILVYLFLVLTGVSLFLEIQLNEKRRLLTDRNHLQEDYFVKIARTVEKATPNKDATTEIKKDISPIEAKIVDIPETENILEDYTFYLEEANLETFDWKENERAQLRNVWVFDPEGKVVMDGDRPLMRGPGTEDEILNMLYTACQGMQTKLNNTRAELTKLRGILEDQVAELNKLKPLARQDKVTIVEKNEKIAQLEEIKADLENQIVKIKNQIDELNAEITSLKDEVVTARDETEATKEELAKSQKLVEQLKKLIQEMIQREAEQKGDRTNITSLPAGEKGKIIEADNENMFAIVEFTDAVMKELKGDNLDHPIPNVELGVKRPGFHGEAGEFVGRIRLRQEVKEKNYVICDILSSWEQDKLAVGDVIFAD
mgnify:CR=1 FL=1